MQAAGDVEPGGGVLSAALDLREAGIGLRVNFGSAEHPEWDAAKYARPADDDRFHFVRAADGSLRRVHDTQFEEPFRRWLELNPCPCGRWQA